MNKTKCSKIGFAFGTALLGALTGCVVDGPRHATVYAPPPPPVYVESVRDDYVYYPRHQVYYSNTRRQYVYRDGRSWVWRPVPPRVSVDVLLTTPSVRLDFHDSPAIHHSTVVRKYPKHWAPPGGSPNRGHGNRDDHNRNDRGNRR